MEASVSAAEIFIRMKCEHHNREQGIYNNNARMNEWHDEWWSSWFIRFSSSIFFQHDDHDDDGHYP